MSIVDKQTITLKKKEVYSDFLINFDLNPVTGNLAKVTNEESIKQALRNLLLTDEGERFYHTKKGSRIKQVLFEPASPITIEKIKILVREAILNYEPRVELHEVDVADEDAMNLDTNSYRIKVVFSTINIPNPIDLELSLKRVR